MELSPAATSGDFFAHGLSRGGTTPAADAGAEASCLESALAGSAIRGRASSTSRSTPRKVDLYLPLS